MNKRQSTIQKNRAQRQRRIRARISGTATRPRLCVSRGNRGMYVQLINDENGVTIAAVHAKMISEKGSKTTVSAALGKLIAETAAKKNISTAVFDRRGNAYHGRVRAVAEAAREAGLTI